MRTCSWMVVAIVTAGLLAGCAAGPGDTADRGGAGDVGDEAGIPPDSGTLDAPDPGAPDGTPDVGADVADAAPDGALEVADPGIPDGTLDGGADGVDAADVAVDPASDVADPGLPDGTVDGSMDGMDAAADAASDAPDPLAEDLPEPPLDTHADVPDGSPEDASEVADVVLDLPPDVPPPTHVLGLPLLMDGQLYAGAAKVDITPVLSPDHPVWMAGLNRNRQAEGIHDPLWARALVLSRDGEYVAFVALDLIGVLSWRLDQATALLAAEGFAPGRLMTQSLHNHNGPDSLGLWGHDESQTGVDPDYQQRVVEAIADSVRQACASAVPATLRAGSRAVGDLSPYLTSQRFGGKNTQHDRMKGLVGDSRDPVVIDDTVTAFGLFGADGQAVATVAHVNNHVEVSEGGSLLSSDFAHPLRELLEARFGGVGILWLGAEGGLQTTWNIVFPVVDAQGALVFQTCDAASVGNSGDVACFGQAEGSVRRDADGDPVPAWSPDDRWKDVEIYGRLVGRVAADLLQAAPVEADPVIEVRDRVVQWPLQNRFMEIAAISEDPTILDPLVDLVKLQYPDQPELLQSIEDMKKVLVATIIDTPPEALVTGPACPEVESEGVAGCMPSRVWMWRLGPLGFATMPGEVFPEWWLGQPAGASAEWTDASRRGPGSTYFPASEPACAGVSWDECGEVVTVGECNCLNSHVVPYPLPADPPAEIVRRALGVTYPRVLGVTGNMTGYMVPAADYHRIPLRPVEEMFNVVYITETLGFMENTRDHYEEMVGLGPAVEQKGFAALQSMAAE